MHNLIQLELYKLLKNKLFFILLILITFISFIINLEFIVNMPKEEIPSFSIIENIEGIFFVGNLLLTIVTIMTAVFIYLDYSNNFVKNIYPSLKNKSLYIVGKILCFLVMNFLILLTIFIVFICSYIIICTKNSYSISLNYIEIIKYFMYQLLNLTSVSSLILLIYLISNNIIATSVFAIIFSGGAVDGFIVSALSLFKNENIISIYTSNISSYYKLMNFNSFNLYSSIITFICILTLFIISAFILSRKKEYI